MSDRDHTAGNQLSAVEARLRDMRKRKDVRWTMSQETAEMAIAALVVQQKSAGPHKRSAKGRRRKRGKKLL